MVDPYTAVGLIPSFWGISTRADIARNLEHLEKLTTAAYWLSNLDVPVRLVAIPEGALQGFNDEILDSDHREYAHECAIDIPGPETDRLGLLAKKFNVYIMAQAKARHPEWPDLYFNVGFTIAPSGEIVLKHYKLNGLLPVERSVSPHDLFDWWVETYGRSIEAFWPVAHTDIGRLGVMMAMEGMFPENGRGLALNGAEVVYRASLPTPFTENDYFEITNRSRALENNFYVVAPNCGANYASADETVGIDTGGGRSMIVDYRGGIVGKQTDTNGPTFVSGAIDIESLRHHRATAQATNWLKDVRAELAHLLYEQPVYPKNRYLDRLPGKHREFREQVIDHQIQLLQQRDVWLAPGRTK